MLSGPDALDGLMFLSSFSTPSVFIFIDGIVDFRFMWVSGMLLTLPLVNTEENCFVNICAFSLLWLTSFPFSFGSATPILFCLRILHISRMSCCYYSSFSLWWHYLCSFILLSVFVFCILFGRICSLTTFLFFWPDHRGFVFL